MQTLADYLGLFPNQLTRKWDDKFEANIVAGDTGLAMYEPEPAFYCNMPDDAAAVFTRTMGHVPPRQVTCPYRTTSHWLGLKIHEYACGLRLEFGELVGQVEKPVEWMDLYKYFDAAEIYLVGAYNMWNVISLLATENEAIKPQVAKEQGTIVDNWVNHWAAGLGNTDRLEQWTAGADILKVLHPGDYTNGGIGQLNEPGKKMVRCALEELYYEVMEQRHQSQVRNWLRKFPSSPYPIQAVVRDNANKESRDRHVTHHRYHPFDQVYPGRASRE